MSTATHSLIETIRTATESRDADTLAGLYADDAEVTIVDRSTPPSSPRVLHGAGEVEVYLRDACAGEMTHRFGDLVEGEGCFAHTVRCRYPDGTRVLCMTVAELDGDGRIARQTIVQAWDD